MGIHHVYTAALWSEKQALIGEYQYLYPNVYNCTGTECVRLNVSRGVLTSLKSVWAGDPVDIHDYKEFNNLTQSLNRVYKFYEYSIISRGVIYIFWLFGLPYFYRELTNICLLLFPLYWAIN